MKKLIAMLLCLVMVFGIVGCGSNDAKEHSESPNKENVTVNNGNGASGHKVGFIQLTLGTTYHAAMSEKFEALCMDSGVDVIMTCSQNRTAE